MRLLFVTATRIGDAVLSTGLLDHLLKHHDDLRVTVACGAPAAPLFEALPGLEGLLVLQKRRWSLHWLPLWAACVGRVWDIIVDLRNAPVTRLLRARRRWHAGRMNDRVHRVVGLAEVLGLENDPPAPRLWIGDRHRRTAKRMIPDGSPVLAVGPTANWHGKVWPAGRFADLIARLTAADGILPHARVAVFGHGSERAAAQPVLDAIPTERRVDLIGRLGLLEVHACLYRCSIYVGNDSGLMHLAAAAGIPTLGLFGPSRESLYAPWGARCAAVRPLQSYEELIGPDYDRHNPGPLMDGLTVDRVETAARDLWLRVSAPVPG